mgnify:CR=1 FL=1
MSNCENRLPAIAPQTEQNNLIGKSVAGYQCWFKCGETMDRGWHHWNHATAPGRGHITFELFPDLSEYPDEVMHDTFFDPMPDGRPTRVFHSKTQGVIDVQFGWMKRYGIAGAAVQRFYTDALAEDEHGVIRDDGSHLPMIRDAAERHDRLFYVMYDMSGSPHFREEIIERMKADVTGRLEAGGIVTSPAYAHADGKPVICIWGLNSKHPQRYPDAEIMLPLVRWLKERGYYLIGGICDDDWREDETAFGEVYRQMDMLSPWMVGRFGPANVEAFLERQIAADCAYCEQYGKVYQPVMYPGFAWSNWHSGRPNSIPRLSGEFLWKQAKMYAKAGIRNGYFAMFDEYDEGTAYMKAATDSCDIPTGEQYFQTLSADGQWLSSDFYLRLAGEVSRLLRGEVALTETVAIPYSEGPIYWRNGFERRYVGVRKHMKAPRVPEAANVDVCEYNPTLLCAEAATLTEAGVVEGMSNTGRWSYRFFGELEAGGTLCYQLAETRIEAPGALKVTFALNPQSTLGGVVTVALRLADGSLLHCPAVEKVRHDVWQTVSHVLEVVPGTVVTGIALYVSSEEAGECAAYVDDIVVERA